MTAPTALVVIAVLTAVAPLVLTLDALWWSQHD